ncbi:ATP synthase subunit ATP5MPL, mitochondrial-like [Nematolebias whitei]|uniref:ATP synthase subunit ATP5MPL, mitochondrial-like n=1 Tax=Nematolebias whitei TaxID=451745 RepID=UPI00189706D1|nr:ATP synthase subunit ATP5MPL, mitochondrial-like [Nematolebias whitei]
MAGQAFSNWWKIARPYVKAYREVWIGFGIVSVVVYKIKYGGKKAVADKPAH